MSNLEGEGGRVRGAEDMKRNGGQEGRSKMEGHIPASRTHISRIIFPQSLVSAC